MYTKYIIHNYFVPGLITGSFLGVDVGGVYNFCKNFHSLMFFFLYDYRDVRIKK